MKELVCRTVCLRSDLGPQPASTAPDNWPCPQIETCLPSTQHCHQWGIINKGRGVYGPITDRCAVLIVLTFTFLLSWKTMADIGGSHSFPFCYFHMVLVTDYFGRDET